MTPRLAPTTTLGYGTIDVVSGGGAKNFLDLDTNATTTSTIVVTGAQSPRHLRRCRNWPGAMNIANLKTFDASAATGDITAWFFGRGTGALTATGGSGNDTFVFGSRRMGPPTSPLRTALMAAPAPTRCRLRWRVEPSCLLALGPTSPTSTPSSKSLTTCNRRCDRGHQRRHVAGGIGDYARPRRQLRPQRCNCHQSDNRHDGDVRGPGPDDTSTGSDLGTLTLSHATPVGLLDTVNFTMNSTTVSASGR